MYGTSIYIFFFSAENLIPFYRVFAIIPAMLLVGACRLEDVDEQKCTSNRIADHAQAVIT